MSERLSDSAEITKNFAAELNAIVETPLSPDTVETYANTALKALIDLTKDAADAYQLQPVYSFDSSKALEDAAFAYYGLERIDETLNHLVDKANELEQIDYLIAGAILSDEVIVPPDDLAINQAVNNSAEQETPNGPEAKRLVPKLKTLLFIIKNEYSIDLDNPEHIRIEQGQVDPQQRRRASYYLILAHKLNRTILVCDEVGNATYIYDTSLLKQHGIGIDTLRQAGKKTLDSFATPDNPYGKRIMYSKGYVPNVISALENPDPSALNTHPNRNAGSYLAPKAPEGILPISGIKKSLDIPTNSVMIEALEQIQDKLGEVALYRFGSRTVPGYTPEQQRLIHNQLKSTGYFDKAPEGFAHCWALTETWGTSVSVIKRATAQLGDQLGEVKLYKSKSKSTPHYSPEQQALIYAYLEADGVFSPTAPEEYDSTFGLAKLFGVDHSTVAKVIDELKDSFGDVERMSFAGQVTAAFSPWQQNAIYDQLKRNGLIVPVAPEGVLSITGVTRALGLSTRKSIYRILETVQPSLGDVKSYRFGSRRAIAHGYTAKQQAIIKAALAEEGTLVTAPEGFAHIPAISESLDVGAAMVRKAIKQLGDRLGDVNNYRAGPGPVPHYSPEQQSLIENFLRQNGYIDNDPPEDYLPATTIADKNDLTVAMVSRAVKKLGASLGEIHSYKYKTKVTPGYSPEQQAMIVAHIRKER